MARHESESSRTDATQSMNAILSVALALRIYAVRAFRVTR